jgi:hypothetical protein
MSRTARSLNFQVFNGRELNDSFLSVETDVAFRDRFLYLVSWTNGVSLNGRVFVEFSNDRENWHELDMGQPMAVNGASGNHQILVNLTVFKYVRLGYERTAGNGLMDAFIGSVSEGV